MWKVYCYTTPSNKKYIGITAYSLEQRMKNGYNQYFTNALKKYGKDNVRGEILVDNLTFEEAQKQEQYYIHLYDTTNKEKGYNITHGGEGYTLYDYYDILEEFKKHNNFKLTLEKFGCTSKTLLNILEGFGYNRQELISDIYRQNYLENRNTTVLQYDLKGNFIQMFDTALDAAKAVGLKSASSISEVCNNKRNKAGNFYWRFKLDLDEIPQKINVQFSEKRWKTKIGQYTLDNKLIRIYDSITEANLSLGKAKNDSSITAVCKGRRRTAFGYIWKYEEGDISPLL